jgi:hypothetical protein
MSISVLQGLAARAGALLLAAALAGCAASGAAAYKAKPAENVAANTPAFGYYDVKVDASHYSITYTANNPNQAQAYMRLRAAQVAQAAGFSYFTNEKQASAAQKVTDASFNANQITGAGATSKGASSSQYNALYDNDTSPTSITMFYTSAAEIALLTPAQAQGNSAAVAVASVLADAPKS